MKNRIAWCHHDVSWWDWHWRENMTSPDRVLPTSTDIGMMTMMDCDEEHWDAAKINQAIVEQRDAGFKTMVGMTAMIHKVTDRVSGNEFASWFDRTVWHVIVARMIEVLGLARGRISIDFEPYWPAASSQRYPRASDFAALHNAIEPFANAVRNFRIEICTGPGGLHYILNDVLRSYGCKLTMMDQRTYYMPTTGAGKFQPEVGHGYIPGFYDEALRKPRFMDEVSAEGFDESWIFFKRGDGAKYRLFGKPEFGAY